jgi:hypothetical protein
VVDVDGTAVIGPVWETRPNPAVLTLVQHAVACGLSLHFVTNRPDTPMDRERTNADVQLFPPHATLCMRDKNMESNQQATFKTGARKALESGSSGDGLRIVLNVGNEEHDTEGGHADAHWLVEGAVHK